MAQWEMCRVTSVTWSQVGTMDTKVVLDYFTPTGVITKSPSLNWWGLVFATLAAAEWEAVTIQHGLIDVGGIGVTTNWLGTLRGIYVNHPSGDKYPHGGEKWKYEYCDMVAYFKRPIQAGRKIDDAL